MLSLSSLKHTPAQYVYALVSLTEANISARMFIFKSLGLLFCSSQFMAAYSKLQIELEASKEDFRRWREECTPGTKDEELRQERDDALARAHELEGEMTEVGSSVGVCSGGRVDGSGCMRSLMPSVD